MEGSFGWLKRLLGYGEFLKGYEELFGNGQFYAKVVLMKSLIKLLR